MPAKGEVEGAGRGGFIRRLKEKVLSNKGSNGGATPINEGKDLQAVYREDLGRWVFPDEDNPGSAPATPSNGTNGLAGSPAPLPKTPEPGSTVQRSNDSKARRDILPRYRNTFERDADQSQQTPSTSGQNFAPMPAVQSNAKLMMPAQQPNENGRGEDAPSSGEKGENAEGSEKISFEEEVDHSHDADSYSTAGAYQSDSEHSDASKHSRDINNEGPSHGRQMKDGAAKSSGDLSATELEEPPLGGDEGGDHGGAQNAFEEGAGTVDRLTQSLNTPGGYWSYWIQEHGVQNDDGTFFVPDWLCQCLLIDREAVWHYAHYFSSQEGGKVKTEAELEDAQRRLNEEEESRQRLNEEKTELQERLAKASNEMEQLKQANLQLRQEKEALEQSKGEGVEEGGLSQEDMNDLLVCLGQEEKRKSRLMDRLKELGEDTDALLDDIEREEEEKLKALAQGGSLSPVS